MKIKVKLIIILWALLLSISAGCQGYNKDEAIQANRPSQEIEEKEIEDAGQEEPESEPVERDLKAEIDLSLKPNEAGDIMILMYHNVGEEEAEWTRTPENLRKDLETLYEKGYRAISLKDYVNNNMDIEAGKTPVILTFDDGNENNFRMIEDENGEHVIDPRSALGILEEFKEDYPDFGTTATFFVFGNNPFRQREFLDFKLNFLVENGYDIGNHTIDHRSVKKIDDKEIIQEVIGRQVEIIGDILPGYEMNTYALCYGERPENKELEEYLGQGSYGDISYRNIAILNVGWNPAPSPITSKFNPLSLPRVRASETKVDKVGIYNWLEYFDKNPHKRYISDGVSELTTIPKSMEDLIDPERIGEGDLYIYE
ncbi:MAG: polysaccharide deacetylase family protein [Tissierellaceae bacterium]